MNAEHAAQHAAIFGTTTTPCPPWCDQTPGHGYDCSDTTMETRIHTRTVGTVRGELGREVLVMLHAAENVLLGPDGMRVEVVPVRCEVSADADDLTVAQTLELSRLLRRAAAVLSRIQAS